MRPSRVLMGLDPLLRLAFVYPFRCRLCGHRFHALSLGRPRPPGDPGGSPTAYLLAARIPARCVSGGEERPGTVTSLGPTGCWLECEGPLVPGDRLRLDLAPEGGEPRVRVADATVRYAGPWRVEIRFLQMDAADQDRLGLLLRSLGRRPGISSRAGSDASRQRPPASPMAG